MKTVSISHVRMPSLTTIGAAAIGFMLVGFAATASAQSSAKVAIDFAFVAAKTEFAAGAYEFRVEDGKVVLQTKDPKGESVFLSVITRLGRHDKDPDAELIFDKVEGKLMLSEIWLPGSDGYLVLNTPRDHEHRVVGGSAPHK